VPTSLTDREVRDLLVAELNNRTTSKVVSEALGGRPAWLGALESFGVHLARRVMEAEAAGDDDARSRNATLLDLVADRVARLRMEAKREWRAGQVKELRSTISRLECGLDRWAEMRAADQHAADAALLALRDGRWEFPKRDLAAVGR
jgi:hypothetical protein